MKKSNIQNNPAPLKRTRFHYEIEVQVGCDHCKELMPLGPLRSFVVKSGLVLTRCPACGKTSTTKKSSAGKLLRSQAYVSTLLELGRTPDDIKKFDGEHRMIETLPYHYRLTGSVGGPERCMHCGHEIYIPAELQPDSTATARCSRCGGINFLFSPPQWLRKEIPTLTHFMFPAMPPTITCAACDRNMPLGPSAPSWVRCDACGAMVAVSEIPVCPEGIDRPMYTARLALTGEAVRIEKGWINPIILIALLVLLMVPGLVYLTIEAVKSVDWRAAGLMGFMAVIVAIIGTILLVMGLRHRKRCAAIISELGGR